MSSPRKRGKMPMSQGRQLSEPALPLHLALGWIINRLFPVDHDCQPVPVYSPQFTSSILKIIAREILEVASAPATFTSLRDELDPLVRTETAEVVKRNNRKRSRGQVVPEEFAMAEEYEGWMSSFADRFADVAEGCAFLDRLEKELRERLNFSDDDEERHSPLGVFSRNLLNLLRRLSFDETTHLAREIARWCELSHDGPSKVTGAWSLDRKSAMEDTLDKRISAMQDYQAANASGDWSHALESLRRFYDYQFPSSGRGQHQHALLNIASFHYMTGGLESAQAAVNEAIRVARTAGDKACLRHCLSLLNRLRVETTSSAFTATESIRIHQTPIPRARLAASTTPMDELWSVKAALDLGEPVHIAFRRIHSALGKETQTDQGTGDAPSQWRTGESLDTAAWHATQAGSDVLAEHHEELALAEMTPREDGRLTVWLARAQRSAERAEYDEALSMLLDLSLIEGISVAQYHRWARVVWSVLERRATMNGDTAEVLNLKSLHPSNEAALPTGPGGPGRDTGHPPSPTLSLSPDNQGANEDGLQTKTNKQIVSVQEHVRSALRKATKLLESSAPSHIVLPHILAAVQLSSELGLWSMYRFGLVVLAEVLLGMEGGGMAEKVVREIEGVWDQILGGSDQEAIARGALCLGQAKIELGLDQSSAYLNEAREHLRYALEVGTKVESRSIIKESTALLSLLAELDHDEDKDHMIDERDRMAEEYMAASRDSTTPGTTQRRQQAKHVVEVVKIVGVRAAEGWR